MIAPGLSLYLDPVRAAASPRRWVLRFAGSSPRGSLSAAAERRQDEDAAESALATLIISPAKITCANCGEHPRAPMRAAEAADWQCLSCRELPCPERSVLDVVTAALQLPTS
jgi:hypothetical protein